MSPAPMLTSSLYLTTCSHDVFAQLIRLFNNHFRSRQPVSLTNLITEMANIVRHPSANFDAIRQEVENFFITTLLRYESALHKVGNTEVTVQDASKGTQLHDLLVQWWDGLINAGRVEAQTNQLLAAPGNIV